MLRIGKEEKIYLQCLLKKTCVSGPMQSRPHIVYGLTVF